MGSVGHKRPGAIRDPEPGHVHARLVDHVLRGGRPRPGIYSVCCNCSRRGRQPLGHSDQAMTTSTTSMRSSMNFSSAACPSVNNSVPSRTYASLGGLRTGLADGKARQGPPVPLQKSAPSGIAPTNWVFRLDAIVDTLISAFEQFLQPRPAPGPIVH